MSIIFKIAGSLRRCYTGFMSLTLKDLDPKIRQSAIRLPYRVGLWMSLADGTGGNTSDKEEQKALETLIMAYSEDFVKSQFVQALMEECMKERGDWINWVENIEDVPKECRDVIAALNGKLERGDIEAFKSNLIEIGYNVALAYREFDYRSGFLSRLNTYWVVWKERFSAFISGNAMKSNAELLNISAREREALRQLGESLGREIREAA